MDDVKFEGCLTSKVYHGFLASSVPCIRVWRFVFLKVAGFVSSVYSVEVWLSESRGGCDQWNHYVSTLDQFAKRTPRGLVSILVNRDQNLS